MAMIIESKSSFMARPFVVVGVWKQQHTTDGRATYFKEDV